MISCIQCGGKIIKEAENDYICDKCGRVISFTEEPIYHEVDGDMI